jgi:Late exocytosis, associated with Golgi transport/Cytosolic domain of 10TM putative phosphate transporter
MGNIIPKWLINYQAFQQTPNANFRDIGLAAAANACIGAALFAYWTRKRWLQQSWFSVKLGGRPPDLPPPQAGVFAFLPALLRINEATFLKYAGFDALVYIRMYLLAAKIAAAVAVYAWCVILPLNVMGGNAPDSAVPLNNFSLLSMSNIASGSPRLWAHVGGTLLLTLSAYYFLNGEFTTYMRLRHAYLRLRAPHLRTVMLDKVPAELRGAAQLFVYFNHLYTDSVNAVACMQDLRPLRALINRREAVLAQLERIMLKQQQQQQQQQQQSSHSAAESSLSSERSRLERRLAELNIAVSRQQSARLRALRQNDERVLREVEAGGYMTSASFRPDYSTTCSRHTVGVASTTTVAGAAATTAGDSSGSTASSSSDSGSDDTTSTTTAVIAVTEQQSSEGETACSCAAISIEEYLKRLGSARSSSANADTVLEFDDSSCCYIDSDSYYSSQQQRDSSSSATFAASARRLWQQLQHARHVAVQWTRHAVATIWNSDSDVVRDNQDDSRQPLLLPLIATDGSSNGSGRRSDAAHCVRMAPRAFVTFKTFKEATVARQVRGPTIYP